MKKVLILLLSSTMFFASGCKGLSHDFKSYTFRNLSLKYPKSMELAGEEVFPDKDFVSFFLTDKADRKSKIEFGISEFAKDFLKTVPDEELMGELAAEVDEMQKNTLVVEDIEVLEQTEILWSEKPSSPEAYSFYRIREGNEIIYMSFSAKVVGNYCVCSICRSGDPSTMELFNNVLDSLNNS